MHRIGVVGISWRHRRADVLGAFTIPREEREERVPKLAATTGVRELVYLATCNRVEVAFAIDGGDDYLPKPFQLRELLLRVAAILRRRSRYHEMTALEPVARFGGNEFDFRSFRGRSFDGGDQILTQKEAMILKVLVEREGDVVWRDEILEKVWGDDVLPSSRTIDNFIARLRKRFEPDPERPRFFHTVRGIGYRFVSAGEESAS